MFISVIHLLLILQCGNLVSAGHVLQWIPDGVNTQYSYDHHEKEHVVQTTNHEVKSPSGEVFKIVCEVYDNVRSKADIYTNEGINIETLVLPQNDMNACKETNLEHYIEPQDRENGNVKIVYMKKGTPPKCVSRTYEIEVLSFMALVKRNDVEETPVKCSDKVNQFIKSFPKPEDAVGVEEVGPPTPSLGGHEVSNFTNHVVSRGTPQTVDFPEKDLMDKKFKLICQEETLSVPDPLTKKDKIIVGSIIHEVFEEENSPSENNLVVDRFQLTSCDVSFININRRVLNSHYIYRVVFKTAEGDCYDRHYVRGFFIYVAFYFGNKYERTSKKVTCPEKFTGDIKLNAHTRGCEEEKRFSVEICYGDYLKEKMAYLAEHNIPY